MALLLSYETSDVLKRLSNEHFAMVKRRQLRIEVFFSFSHILNKIL